MSVLALTSLVGCDHSNSSTSGSNSASSLSSSSNISSSENQKDLISISLNKTTTSILLNSTETLAVTYNPTDASDKEIEWSSEDETIASVSNGVVTAKKIGSTVIKATSKNNTAISASCTVTVTNNVVLSNVNAKHEFVVFNQNKNKDSKNDDGFFDREQTYKVGDDNAFNVKPELTVVDAQTYLPVSASKWLFDFTISVEMNNEAVGNEYYSVLDARECDIKFTEAAVGHTFTINVTPGGIDASKATNFTKSITVDVIDGYNVYDPKELGYFDTRAKDSEEDSFMTEEDKMWQCKWYDFKEANEMRTDYHPSSLILQKDIKVTTADIPSNFLYTAEQAAAMNDTKSANSLIDEVFLYEHTIGGDMTVDGNYFELDLSAIPLVTRERRDTTEVGKVVSHAAAFKAINGNEIKFRNINMSGNAMNAITDADKIYGGGFIFAKGAGCNSFSAYNIIAANFFITFMGEDPYYIGSTTHTQFNLEKVKCFNNYNSFLYNWGSDIVAKDSLFRSCGGPIVIQDQTNTDDYEAANGLIVLGYTPTTNFIDCELKNYVAGGEAWFQQFGADAVTPLIKAMSDLLGATGLPKSFVVNSAREGKFYQALAAQTQKSFFNFVAFNKSGRSEGMTNVPASGTVNITVGEHTDTFDYRTPANTQDPVALAYVAYATASDEQKEAALQTLIGTAMAAGVTFAPDFSDAEVKIVEYLTPIVGEHVALRTFNSNGAPVFDLGPNYPLLSISNEEATFLQSVFDIAAGGTTPYAATDEQKEATPDYMALYYNGMMLVLELAPYVD